MFYKNTCLLIYFICQFARLNGDLSIEIIELNQDEWQLYRDIRLKSVQEIPHAFGSSYNEELEETEAGWRRRLKHGMIFARIGDEIVGMIGAVVDTREKLRHHALLISFYVVPELRRHGIGTTLLKHLMDKLHNLDIKKISLRVTTNQIEAIKLYMGLGFSIEGILKNEYLVDNIPYDHFLMSYHDKTLCIKKIKKNFSFYREYSHDIIN